MNARSNQPRTEERRGCRFGAGACGLWGVLPICFKAIDEVGPIAILAHRVLWSVPFLLPLLCTFGGTRELRRVAGEPRTIGFLAVTAMMIATNWLLYVHAVASGHILAALRRRPCARRQGCRDGGGAGNRPAATAFLRNGAPFAHPGQHPVRGRVSGRSCAGTARIG